MGDFILDHPVLSKAAILLSIIIAFWGFLWIVVTVPILIVAIPLLIIFGGLLFFLCKELWDLATSIYDDITYWIQTR